MSSLCVFHGCRCDAQGEIVPLTTRVWYLIMIDEERSESTIQKGGKETFPSSFIYNIRIQIYLSIYIYTQFLSLPPIPSTQAPLFVLSCVRLPLYQTGYETDPSERSDLTSTLEYSPSFTREWEI